MIVYLWIAVLLSWIMTLINAGAFLGSMINAKAEGTNTAPIKFLVLSVVWFAFSVAGIYFIVSGG